jgi:hypothetical protein
MFRRVRYLRMWRSPQVSAVRWMRHAARKRCLCRGGSLDVSVWNVPTSHAQEPPGWQRTYWRLSCAIVGRRLGRGVADGKSSVLRAHSSGFRTQSKRGTGCDWGAAAVRHVVLSGCVNAAVQRPDRRARMSARSVQAAISTGGDACFFTQSQRIGGRER